MAQIKPPRRPGFNGVHVVDVHVNVDQEIIQITEDKLRLILKDHLETITQSTSWVAPLGVMISIITTFCTAKFDTFIGLGPEFWKSLFTLAGIASLAWLFVAWRNGQNVMTLDAFISKVKNKS